MFLYYLIVIKGDMCGLQSEINLANCPMFWTCNMKIGVA